MIVLERVKLIKIFKFNSKKYIYFHDSFNFNTLKWKHEILFKIGVIYRAFKENYVWGHPLTTWKVERGGEINKISNLLHKSYLEKIPQRE